jgi:ArsR family transcriptional regulator
MSMQCCSSKAKTEQSALIVEAALFKALGDETRLKILATLARSDGEVCVCEFTDTLPLNQPTVSHHLRILREAELVTCERRGTWVYYRLATTARDCLDAALNGVFQEKVPA